MKLGIEGKRDISAAHPKNVRDLEQNCANLVVTARVIRNVLHRDQAWADERWSCSLLQLISDVYHICLCARWLAHETCQTFQLKFAFWALPNKIAVKFFELKFITNLSCLWLVWLVAGCTLHAVNCHTHSCLDWWLALVFVYTIWLVESSARSCGCCSHAVYPMTPCIIICVSLR